MNAILEQKIALAEALVAAARDVPSTDFRAAAKARFLKMGAPVKRDEYWRYTDPARLTAPPAPAADAGSDGRDPFADIPGPTAVFVDGAFRPDLSDNLTAEGVEVTSLAQAEAAPDLAARLGALEMAGHAPVERPLAALNGALATDGLLIRVRGAVARPLKVRYAGASAGALAYRHLILVDPGAEATVIESGVGAKRLNTVTEAEIGEGGALHMARTQTDPEIDQVAAAQFVRLGARASFKGFTLTGASPSSAPLIRNECVIWLEGDHASGHVGGGVLGHGDAVIDNTIFVTHGALDGESRQVFKNVLEGRAQGVFQGKILVREGAQKTDGYQISQSILLSEKAEFDAKPELEIYADDVKCSHGSTTGALDETALFYLRSRGVPQAMAEALLVAAFVDEAIEEIADDALQDVMRAEVAAWMSARAA